MNKLIPYIIGLVFGIAATGMLMRTSITSARADLLDCAKGAVDIGNRFSTTNKKWAKYQTDLTTLANSYHDAKTPAEKAKISESMVTSVREFNLF